MTEFRDKRVGIFAMDPGQTTGLAYGCFTLRGSTKEIFERDKPVVGQIQCWNIDAQPFENEVEGAANIVDRYLACLGLWQNKECIPPEHIMFVCEDFILRGPIGSTDRAGISPVRVTSLVMGMLYGEPVQWCPQQASLAKGRFTNDRLRSSGLWTVGMEHGRDATRHLATWASRQLG